MSADDDVVMAVNKDDPYHDDYYADDEWYIWRKINIWNVESVRATAFISTHERMFLWKCHHADDEW